MLVLSRMVDECIYIGDDIRIKIVDIKRTPSGRLCARLGIEAPKEIPVHREEIYVQVKKGKNKEGKVE